MRINDAERGRIKRAFFRPTTHPYEPTWVSTQTIFDSMSAKVTFVEFCGRCGQPQDDSAHHGVRIENDLPFVSPYAAGGRRFQRL